MTETDEVGHIFDVATQFTEETIDSIVPVTDGAINQTFEVATKSGDVFILQGMSRLFEPTVIDNLLAVKPLLDKAKVAVPDCRPTIDGKLYFDNEERWYRALTYVPGNTIHDNLSPAGAKSAANLIAQFHGALLDCEAEIVAPIKHYHDNDYYMARMQRIAEGNNDEMKNDTLRPLVEVILEKYQAVSNNNTVLPKRIIHDDLKVSNIRFSDEMEALALIDMDTMTRNTIQIELGDALRSWCGTAGEDSVDQVFDKAVYDAAMEGYKGTAVGITEEEIASVPEGIRMLTLGLSARFVTDAYEETYFAKSSKYPSLYEQNKTKAENQLRFLKAVEESGIL